MHENKRVVNGGAPQSPGSGNHRVNINCKDHQESRTVIIVKDTVTCSSSVTGDIESSMWE